RRVPTTGGVRMALDSFDLQARLLPERLRLDLARIGAVLATEQLLSGLVVDNLAGFLDPTTPVELDGYRRRPDEWETRLHESLVWLVEHEALTADDAAIVGAFRDHALELMADIPSWLLGDGKAVKVDLLTSAAEVLARLDRFWGRIAVDVNPDFDSGDVADDDITGGSMAVVGVLLHAVSEP